MQYIALLLNYGIYFPMCSLKIFIGMCCSFLPASISKENIGMEEGCLLKRYIGKNWWFLKAGVILRNVMWNERGCERPFCCRDMESVCLLCSERLMEGQGSLPSPYSLWRYSSMGAEKEEAGPKTLCCYYALLKWYKMFLYERGLYIWSALPTNSTDIRQTCSYFLPWCHLSSQKNGIYNLNGCRPAVEITGFACRRSQVQFLSSSAQSSQTERAGQRFWRATFSQSEQYERRDWLGTRQLHMLSK